MKIRLSQLRRLIREAVGGAKILRERPWAIEWTFKLSGGEAEDSEGVGPDGFAVVLRAGDQVARVIVDSYWNPQAGDQSGNSLKWEVNGYVLKSAYVPIRFDSGKEQRLVISNSPVDGLLAISHAGGSTVPPVVYLVVENPFGEEDDMSFDVEKLGNSDMDVEMSSSVNF